MTAHTSHSPPTLHDTSATLVPGDLAARLMVDLAAHDLPDPTTQAQMKARLMSRVRESKTGAATTTLPPSNEGWEGFGPGMEVKYLRRESDTVSYLLRMHPGSILLPHRHRQDEECMVLEGEVLIDGARMQAGSYHLAPKGVDHVPIESETGALLFIRGAPPSWRDIAKWEALKALGRRL